MGEGEVAIEPRAGLRAGGGSQLHHSRQQPRWRAAGRGGRVVEVQRRELQGSKVQRASFWEFQASSGKGIEPPGDARAVDIAGAW